VVDAIDPSVIVSQCASKTFDFGSITDPELINFTIPLQLQIGMPSKEAQGCALNGSMNWIDGINQWTVGTVSMISSGSVACAVHARMLISLLSLFTLVCIAQKVQWLAATYSLLHLCIAVQKVNRGLLQLFQCHL